MELTPRRLTVLVWMAGIAVALWLGIGVAVLTEGL